MIAAGALEAPVASLAQQRTSPPLVVLLLPGAPDSTVLQRVWFDAFRANLVKNGLLEGRDLQLQILAAEGNYERLGDLALQAVKADPAVIVTTANEPLLVLHKATQSVPIVALAMNNPVALGVVASLSRPGGNVTGLVSEPGDREAKLIQILHEAVPKLEKVAVLADTKYPRTSQIIGQMEAYAKSRGIALFPAYASSAAQIEPVLDAAFRQGARALVALRINLLSLFWPKVLAFVTSQRVPAIYGYQEIAEVGGLMGYGTSVTKLYASAADYVAKILRGQKPAELPIEQPSTFELVVNLQTAKALAIKIPQSILLRADRVIE